MAGGIGNRALGGALLALLACLALVTGPLTASAALFGAVRDLNAMAAGRL